MGNWGPVGWEGGPERSPDPIIAKLCDLSQPPSLAGYSRLLTADPRSGEGRTRKCCVSC